MPHLSRRDRIQQLFPDMKPFRLKQIETALFDARVRSWNDVSTLPKEMRETFEKNVPIISVKTITMLNDTKKETFKAVVAVEGEKQIETVLMKNKRGYWTICVSTQVGCAMACAFCATGKMGLTRNLDAEEIVDQYRMWQQFLADADPLMLPLANGEVTHRISNIVYMGMGEPLANYEATKASLNTILAQTEIGNTHITVSTVGILPRLEQILTDKDWPHVRMAVSLHSANADTRKAIVKTSYEDFLPKLDDWARRYLKKFGNRRHHLTFEYVMLKGVNDSPDHAKKLAVFVNRIGNIRVNLIPFNFTETGFAATEESELDRFQSILKKNGVTFTVRRSMGQDITAACGQLVKK
jgi:23S rRNA (adenine2503-C2)-methyltransferase